jgi:hypothetical protein
MNSGNLTLAARLGFKTARDEDGRDCPVSMGRVPPVLGYSSDRFKVPIIP